MDESARRETYEEIATQLAGVLDGCPDAVAAMASTAALLKERFARMFWVGFYLPDADGNLRVGPYQGPIACLSLPAGRGVCGAAFASGETQIVDDVHAIEDHIACDARSRSEIVVPVKGHRLRRTGRVLRRGPRRSATHRARACAAPLDVEFRS